MRAEWKVFIALALALAFTIVSVAMAGHGLSAEVHPNRVVVKGCHSEDSCEANFTRRGTWVIRRVHP